MKFSIGRGLMLVLVVLAGRLSATGSTKANPPLPDAATVMRKVVDKAKAEAPSYCYQKRSRNEEFDASGKVTSRKEETYEVFPIQGVPYSRLVKIESRALTEKEQREQARKEEEFRKSLAGDPQGQVSKTNQSGLDPALVDHFNFQVVARDTNGSRPSLVLAFRPKPAGNSEKTVTDRVLNRLAGTLWVDEADSEITRLKVHLVDELSLGWFGMVGAVKQLDFELEEGRMPAGDWVVKRQALTLRGRKVLSAMRHRTIDEFSNFRKAED